MGDAGGSSMAAAPSVSFQTRDLEDLLNTIDQMRSQGVAGHVDLPQAIVVGDQSSGKSSVLEAICGAKFPVGDSLCTRFATEFVLRRSPEQSLSISIVPDVQRADKEKAKLAKFEYPITHLQDFPKVVAAAGKLMGIDEGSKTFSNDVLRVEVSGPKQPHLTLVDLPGLFHAASSRQTEADRQAVTALVTSYMNKSRSIILAVVSAKNDLNNQIVTKLARSIDQDGRRTLGIITKPDLLHKGSNSEKEFFALAQNKEVKFDLGWHMVVNRDFDTRESTTKERDAAEQEFFSKGLWASLSKSHVGIQSLRVRLSRVLRNQILRELPGLIADVEAGVAECSKILTLLGAPRGSLRQQRSYLHRIAEQFSNLVKDAVKGDYDDDFFGDPETTEGYERRLRAIAQNALDEYSDTMRTKGHKWHLVETDPKPNDKVWKGPKVITIDNYLRRVSKIAKNSRGIELRGTHRAEIIGVLFRDQCRPWEKITLDTVEEIFKAARAALITALEFCADQTTADGIMRCVINPALEKLHNDLEDKAKAQLKTHTDGQPITFNHYFTENVQNLRNAHKRKHTAKKLEVFFGKNPDSADNYVQQSFSTKSLLDTLSDDTEADMDKFACSESTFIMRAYYKVAMKMMVDKFATDAIEECLMSQLVAIFNPQTVLEMEDSVIEDIAGETEESKMERASSSQKLKVLQAALNALRRLETHKPKDEERTKKQGMTGKAVENTDDVEELQEEFSPVPSATTDETSEPSADDEDKTQVLPPSIKHPLFSLPPLPPARGPVADVYPPAKKTRWSRPLTYEDSKQTRMETILVIPKHIKVSNGEAVLLHDYIVQIVTKAVSLTGLLRGPKIAELRGCLSQLFFLTDLQKSINGLITLISAYGGRKAWKDYDAAMLQEHRSSPA